MDLKDKPINQLILELAYTKKEIDMLIIQYTYMREEAVRRYPQLDSELENLQINQNDLQLKK